MKSRLTQWIVAIASMALPLAVFGAGGGGMDGGGGMGGGMSTPRQQSPEDAAKNAYNDGVRAVKQAKKFEEDLAAAKDDKQKAKMTERVNKQYEKARGYFANAVSKKDSMYEAWNYVGYTSRKLGEYDKALSAYDEALRLNPNYAEAMEYRGEAYLWLNRLDDAKKAYMDLFGSQRQLANELMTAMEQWVKARRENASGVAAADIDNFAKWVSERTTIAQQTASLAADAPHTSIWN